MDDDEAIFGQLDRLQRGAGHDGFSSRYEGNSGYLPCDGYGAGYPPHDGYIGMNQHPEDEHFDEPIQLDAFDERLLRQPDHNSRHGQAALGRARLSLPPARDLQHSSTQLLHPVPSQQFDLSHFEYNSDNSSSPVAHRAQASSPSFDVTRRHALQEYRHQASQGRPAYQPQPVPTPRPNQREASYAHQRFSNSTSAISARFVASQNVTKGTPVVQGIDLVPTRQLPDRFRTIFPFPLFNAVQSKCFPVLYQTNDNFVVSAPTGSGKTAVLELAICRLVSRYTSGSFKVVYQAPTKALCSERQRDWQTKFSPLDLQCAELTGDTDISQLRNVQNASIIITTPEKWDSITRKWKDHMKLMQTVKLFLIDEVHILKEDRGATLEAVVSRMKSIGTDVRFVALSATVPNSQDIATWLGKDTMNPQIPAPRERFGEEFRPVRLQKHVCGYQGSSNDFAFEKLLNAKLPEVIAKWSQKKPIMVFCMTRKSCTETAKLLATWWTSKGPRERHWEAPFHRVVVGDQSMKETVACGVAVHHAGLNYEDRIAVEKAYLAGDISVICCTSTLAVGVNLPCHMVIIKNTVRYQNGIGVKEHSDLEIMQMLGRAGRPQFDDSAIAIIMTKLPRVHFYEHLVTGQEILESGLHLNLIDHLNAEITLGTITDVSSAKKWLTGTFLYVRLKEHPEHYSIAEDAPGANLDERLEDICRGAIAQLQDHDLIHGTTKLQSTEFGDAMARYYLQFDSMKILLALPPKAKISEILSAVSQAAEYKEVRFRAGEKTVYKTLNKNGSIKFPIPVNIDTTAHKVSLVIQAVLGSVELPTEDDAHKHEFLTTKTLIFQRAQRLVRCVVDCQLYMEDSVSARNALVLARSFAGYCWDDSPLHIVQLQGLGPVAVRKLVSAGITSIEELESADSCRIERALTRHPPYGTTVVEKARAFPRLRIGLNTIGDPLINKGVSVTVKMRAEIGFMNDKVPEKFNDRPFYVCLLADTSDGHALHFARISAKKLGKGQEVLFSAALKSPSQIIRGYVMCEDVAGTQRHALLKPEIPAFMFPATIPTNDTEKRSELSGKAPNTTRRRAVVAVQPRTTADDDEFGDAGIDDADLAAAADAGVFTSINEFDDDGNRMVMPSEEKKPMPAKRAATTEWREPIRLDNGNWQCNHRCKDKAQCKHECCKTGVENKPRPPRSKEPKNTDAASDPKQTQLNLTRTKKSDASAAREATISLGARELNRLHNSVKSFTPHVPLIKGGPTTQALHSSFRAINRLPSLSDTIRHPAEEPGSDDWGSDDFGTDDFYEPRNTHATARLSASKEEQSLEPDDEMLDCDEGDHAAGRGPLIDLTPYADDLSSQAAASTSGIQSPRSKEKEMIAIGDTSNNDFHHLAAQASDELITAKRPSEDTPVDNLSKHIPPSKKQKILAGNDTSLPDEVATVHHDGDDFDMGQQDPVVCPKPEVEEEDCKVWFEREFGTELFTFDGR